MNNVNVKNSNVTFYSPPSSNFKFLNLQMVDTAVINNFYLENINISYDESITNGDIEFSSFYLTNFNGL